MKFYAILITVILVFLCAPVMFFVWVMPGRPTLGIDLNSLLMGFMIVLLCVSIIALILVFQRYFGRSETDSKPKERTARRTTPVLPVQYIYTQQPPYNSNQIAAPPTYTLPIPPSDQETKP
jgi:membrane protein implicated in regulation of membrane protease activity